MWQRRLVKTCKIIYRQILSEDIMFTQSHVEEFSIGVGSCIGTTLTEPEALQEIYKLANFRATAELGRWQDIPVLCTRRNLRDYEHKGGDQD
jgi:hypothetical protein